MRKPSGEERSFASDPVRVYSYLPGNKGISGIDTHLGPIRKSFRVRDGANLDQVFFASLADGGLPCLSNKSEVQKRTRRNKVCKSLAKAERVGCVRIRYDTINRDSSPISVEISTLTELDTVTKLHRENWLKQSVYGRAIFSPLGQEDEKRCARFLLLAYAAIGWPIELVDPLDGLGTRQLLSSIKLGDATDATDIAAQWIDDPTQWIDDPNHLGPPDGTFITTDGNSPQVDEDEGNHSREYSEGLLAGYRLGLTIATDVLLAAQTYSSGKGATYRSMRFAQREQEQE